MNKQTVNELLTGKKDKEYAAHFSVFKELISTYPFFSAPYVALAQMLKADKSIYADEHLRAAALRVSSRPALYQAIEGKPSVRLQSFSAPAPQVEEIAQLLQPDDTKKGETQKSVEEGKNTGDMDSNQNQLSSVVNQVKILPYAETPPEERAIVNLAPELFPDKEFDIDSSLPSKIPTEEKSLIQISESAGTGPLSASSETIPSPRAVGAPHEIPKAIEQPSATSANRPKIESVQTAPGYLKVSMDVETAAPKPEFPHYATFTDWLSLMKAPLPALKAGSFQPEAEPDQAPKPSEIIERFIQTAPRMTKPSGEFFNPDKAAERAASLDTEIASETLATIFASQGLPDKAIQMYERLILRQPHRSRYFAERIEELQNQPRPPIEEK